MQPHKPQVDIVPVENQADVYENTTPYKGEASDKSGHAAQQCASQLKHDTEKIASSVERNGVHVDSDGSTEEDELSPYLEVKVDDAPYACVDSLPILWTMDEETVLMHSSLVSLERIRTRLEMLLLGVSEAIHIHKASGASKGRVEGKVLLSSSRRSRGQHLMDFSGQVLAADHAFRRIIGESFASFAEEEIVQMVQLFSLANRGPTECEEMVRDAVVVLQVLLHDGEAVRDLARFRQFLSTHSAEISTQQWQYDFVTALRSLAVCFLRHPEFIMASYGHSVNLVVHHEALYVALLRACGGRPVGNTPTSASTLDQVDLAEAKTQSSHTVSTTRLRSSRVNMSLQSKYKAMVIHSPKGPSGTTQLQRSFISCLDPIMLSDRQRGEAWSAPSMLSKHGGGTLKSRRSSITVSRPSVSAGPTKNMPAASKNGNHELAPVPAKKTRTKSKKNDS
ncbi:hypothetical protein MNV84_06654 [Leishmania braziliensis]|nr:hypothetical protein MNV84_06654 [Leishmania braziliensis]